MRVRASPTKRTRAGDQVFHPGGIIENLAIGRGIKRVDGEVAPRRILGPVVGEGDHGMAAIGFHIPAQGGDFEGMLAGDGGDGAVIQARLHHLDALALSRASASSGGMGTAMSISTTGTPSKRIAHGAADKARLTQRRHHRERFGRRHPAMLCRINLHDSGLYHPTARPDRPGWRRWRPRFMLAWVKA